MSSTPVTSNNDNNNNSGTNGNNNKKMYQSIQVNVPNDHYSNNTTNGKSNGSIDDYFSSQPFHQQQQQQKQRRKWLLFCIIVIIIVSMLRIFAWFDIQKEHKHKHDSQLDAIKTYNKVISTENSSIANIDNSSHRVENVLDITAIIIQTLIELNNTIDGRVYVRSIDDEILYKQVAKVWRYDVTIILPLAVIEVYSENDVQVVLPIISHLSLVYNIPFRVRSGGHNKAGYSTIPDGIVVSLKHMTVTKLLNMDDVNKIATSTSTSNTNTVAYAMIQPGATVEIVLDAFVTGTIPVPSSSIDDINSTGQGQVLTQEGGYGGAVGQCGKVAEGGWVLGGGVGFMSRTLGLGLDNVISFTIILYNGTKLETSLTSNTDLFWALRGAGSGNFGIITSMIYKIHTNVPDKQLIRSLTIPFYNLPYFLYQLGISNTNNEFMLIIGSRENILYNNDSITNTTTITDILALSFISWFTIHNNNTHEDTLQYANNHYDTIIQPMIPVSTLSKQETTSSVSSSNTNTTINETNNIPQKPFQQLSELTYTSFLWAENTHDFSDHGGYSQEVYAAQPWQGFLMPINNTIEIWNIIINIIYNGLIESPDLQPHIEYWDGTISTISINDTAFPYRDAIYNVGVLLVIQENDNTSHERFKTQVTNINKWWPTVSQYLSGSYINYPMNSLTKDEYPTVYWNTHLHRLQQIKQKYDPYNVFNYEQSIPPLTNN